MDYLKIVAISLTVSVVALFGFYNFVPVEPIGLLNENSDMLGATITTIQGTDTLKDSRGTINTNFSNLNTSKIESSTTTLPLITSLPGLTTASALATVGTITTGTWNADTLTVAYGGTGSTTLTANGVLVGNGTSPIYAVSPGSEGQILTMTSGVPAWGDSAINETLEYTWTGHHSWTTGTTTFNSLSTFNATSTFNNYISLTDDPVQDTHAIRKSYFDTYNARPGMASSFQNNGAGTTTQSIVTSGTASMLHFVVNIQENEQTGSNSTKIRVYDVWFDIIDQTFSTLTLFTTDAGNDETCGMTSSGGDDDYVHISNSSYTADSSIRVVDEGGNGDSYFSTITSDTDSIDITTHSSADGCIYVGTVFYW